MADGREHGVVLVAVAAAQKVAAQVPIVFQVADHGLDGRATSEFALDGAEDVALLTEDEDATRVSVILAAITRASAYD